MDICRIYADFCMYAVAFLLSFLIFVCELNFAEYMRRPIIIVMPRLNRIRLRYRQLFIYNRSAHIFSKI